MTYRITPASTTRRAAPGQRLAQPRRLLALSALAMALQSAMPLAQAAPEAAGHTYSIQAGSLGQALSRFAAQAQITVQFSPDLTQGLNSSGLRGHYSVEEGLAALLRGTGLQAVFRGDGVYGLVRNPNAALALDDTLVVGQTLDGMTEGTGSYTTGAASIGGKSARALKDIPQSISIITRQRMEDQGITTIGEALDQTTGITLIGGNDANTKILSRGFALTNVQVDGGTPGFREQTYDSLADTTAYDHIEVLRGSDGLFGGTGEPSGVINLVRKRALPHAQTQVNLSAGSWDNYRSEVDVTGPLAFDGALRGRFAASQENKRYFYSGANSDKHVLFGVLEADVTPDTLVSVGGTYEWRDMDGYWENGLPRFTTGDPLGLSRSTTLAADWSSNNYERKEGFLKVEHSFDENWKVNSSFTRSRYDTEQDMGAVSGPVNPDTLEGATFQRIVRNYSIDQDLFDANLQGAFSAFGRRHEVLMGVDYSDIQRSYADHSEWASRQPVDVFSTDIGSLPKPASPDLYYEYPDWNLRKSGAYGTLRLELADPLKLIVGARYSDYSNTIHAVVPSFGTDSKDGGRDSGIVTPFGGLVYSVTPEWSLYTSYAQIYKPQPEILGADLKPLKAITGDTYEMGVKGELFGGQLNLSSAIYYTRQENNAIQLYYEDTPTNACCYVAGGKMISKGFDTEISGELAPGWQLTAGYTFNLNEQRKTGDDTAVGKPISTQTPKHLFKFFTTYQLPGELERWKVGTGATIQSSNYVSGEVQRRLEDGSLSPSTNSFEYTQAGYALWNALVEYRIDEHWTAALNGNNLFDKKYYQTVASSDYGNWYGSPRNFMVTLRGKF
ncbi:TonB-dependent siderophore receptor [Pseudomonas citronellolis]|uniref:TonB-dependent siderophore receptor n=1 Tax=Pseudomonas citronellolis TaxID=53408 RepID=UPI00264A2653|nr:TonB-dependent siderophore receptor [Pseudomonas citronellolis]MDN6873341.1 TonB-dependent siderophore receptor [Pseudomonas citronellolis]